MEFYTSELSFRICEEELIYICKHVGKHTKVKKPRYRDDNGDFIFFRRSEADYGRRSGRWE